MADSQQTAGAVSGIATGAAAGSVFGVPGAIVGGIIGGIAGGIASGGGRAEFRSQRRAEFFRNAALRLQASQTTKVGGQLASGARSASAGAGVRGASITAAQVQGLVDASRARTAILAGVSTEFQSGSGAVIPQDLRPSLASVRAQRAATPSLALTPNGVARFLTPNAAATLQFGNLFG